MLKNIFKRNKKILDFEKNYKLLSDTPLTADKRQDIKFGHSEIAKVIADLVLKADPPFTIGLFGKWGTGKTTIINLVKDNLEEKDVRAIIFDVWKYEADSLRRQFLITLDEELKLNLNYKKILNQSLSKPFDIDFLKNLKINIKNFVTRGGIFFVLLFLLAAVGKYTNLSDWLVQNGWLNPKIIEGLYDFSLFGLILSFLLNSITTVYGVIQEQRTDSAEGFEDRFYNEVLVHPKIQNKKLLIIIDNLDRTVYNKAADLLSDIKTFLGKEKDENKTIFLIACDEEAIKKHLERSNFDDPAEFLRKFFNTSIKIPRFLGEELDGYTRDLLNTTEIEEFKNNYELEWLITYSFRDNPREIKQFINTLISHYLLAMQMEKKRQIISEGIITKRIDALAKLLIIRQKFPNAYQEIERMALSKSLTWQEIEGFPEKIFSEIFIKNDIEERNIEKEKDNFAKFIQETHQIDIFDLPIFIRLRQSEQEQNLPGLEGYIVAAEDRKIDEAKTIFNKFPKDKIKDFDDILKEYIRKAKNTDKLPKIWVLGITTIEATGDSLKYLKNFLRELVLNFPKSSELLRYLDDYPPERVFKTTFPLLDKKYQNEIIQSYLSLFSLSTDKNTSPIPEKYALELIRVIAEHKDDFIHHERIVKEGIKNYFYTEQFISVFVDNNLEKEFVTDEAKEKFIESIKNEDLNSIDVMNRKLKLLSKLTPENILEKNILKINELMRFETQQGVRIEQRLALANFLKDFFTRKSTKDLLKELQNKSAVGTISELIINWYNQNTDPNNRLLYIRIMIQLKEIEGNSYIPNLEDRIRDFISNTINLDVIEKISKKELNYFADFCPQAFRTVIARVPEIFDKVYTLLPREVVDQIIVDFVNSHPQMIPDKLKLINYKLENPIPIVRSMLDRVQGLEWIIQEQYFEVIAKMQCGNDPSLIERFYNILMGLKAQRPETVKRYSRRRFFNDAQKRALQANL